MDLFEEIVAAIGPIDAAPQRKPKPGSTLYRSVLPLCPSEGQSGRNQPYRDIWCKAKPPILLRFSAVAPGFKSLLLHQFSLPVGNQRA